MFTCPKCGQTFLQKKSYEQHASEHQQTHIDTWSSERDISDMPQGLNRELFKLFDRYGVGSSCILCLWKAGQLNTAIRPLGRQSELIGRLKEWVEQQRPGEKGH
jgi:hypothetical protein